MGRLWKDKGLDGLVLTSYCASLSAYNPIEHFWSHLSRQLSGMVLSATAPGDTVPTPKLSKAEHSTAALNEKTRQVMDNAMVTLNTGVWKPGLMYDKWPITSPSSPTPYNDYDEVKARLTAKLTEFCGPAADAKSFREEIQLFLEHCDRRRNELIFLKCRSPTCTHCVTHPVIATDTMKLIREHGGRLFSPTPSSTHPDHFHTYVEMCSLPVDSLPYPDQHQPSFVKLSNGPNPVGRYTKCPSYSFSSKAEKLRHCRTMHNLTARDLR